MKKSNVLKYIIFTFICLCPLMKVNAYLYYIGGDNSKIIREEEVNKREILLVCSYAQKESNYSGGANDYWTSYFERLNIYYTYSGNWEISYDKGVKVFESANKDKYKNQALFATNVYMTEETRKNLNKGICPAQGFIDYAGNDEICFGDASFCRSKSNFGTGFAIENSQKVVTSEKNYDINEDMNIYFEKWVPTFQNCDEFRKSPTNVTDKLKEDFVKNFLNSEKENNVPKFFSKNPTYIQGFDGMKKKYGEYKIQCDKEVDSNPNLTEEEKNTLKKENEAAYENVEEKIDETQEEIKDKAEETYGGASADCNGIFGGKFGEFLKMILNLIKFAVPILIIGLSIIDFIKAIAAQDDKDLKNAANKLTKRMIIGVIIFLLPTLIEFILKLADINSGTCGIR